MYLAKRITITKKSSSLITTNIKCVKNIFLKILNFYMMIKLNNATDFCSSRCKVVIIIFEVII